MIAHPGQYLLPGRPDPAWPLPCSNLGWKSIVHLERAKNHKYPNKHEEKSLENANVRPKSAFLCRCMMNASRSQENECSPGLHVYSDPISDQVSHVSLTAPLDIISDLWLVNHPYRLLLLVVTLRSRGSQFQYQGLWSTVTLLSSVASRFIASYPPLLRFLPYFRLDNSDNMLYFRRRTLVSVSLPASWSDSECARQRGEAGVRGSPDLVIVNDDLSDDSDDDDSDEGVMTLQHLGCGHQGLQVTISQRMFAPSLSIMEHHRKGETISKGNIGWSGDGLSLSLI